MVPVSDAWKNAIKNKAKQKILLEFPDITLTNDDISMDGGLEYTEVLNGDTDLNMGRAVMSSLSVRLINKGQLPDSIYTSEFIAKIGVDIGGIYEYVSLGKFTPERPQRTKSKYVDLQAYDRMHLFEKDASAFLEGLNLYGSPKTARRIYQLVCSQCGVGYSGASFLHENKQLTFDTFRNKEVTYREVLAWIAEMAGSYARINREGLVEFVWFKQQDYTIARNQKFESTVAERITPMIDKLEVYTSYTDIITTSGTGSNLYQIIDNPFLYAENEGEVTDETSDLYWILRSLPEYYPSSVRAEADPAVQCGDIIKFVDDDGSEKILPVFTQTLTWNGYTKAVYESTGQPKRSNLPTEQRMLAGLKKEFVRKADLSTTIDSYLSSEEGKAGIISAVEGEFVTTDVLKQYAKTTEVSATIEQAITAHDATLTLTASKSTSSTETDVSRYASVSGVTYGFTRTDDGYYTSTNAGIDSSFSYGEFLFSFDVDTKVTLRCISYGENNYDYGIISYLNTSLSMDNATDSVHTYYSFRGKSSGEPVDIEIDVPANPNGIEYITFKYIKDSIVNENGDYFKIKALKIEPSTEQKSTITLKSGSTVISSADIIFSGVVTFESLATEGATIINGANIQTGTISADRIDTSNLIVERVYATDSRGYLKHILDSNITQRSGIIEFGYVDYTDATDYDKTLYVYADMIMFVEPGSNQGGSGNKYYISTKGRSVGWL